MADNQDKIFCPVYEVWNTRYACARRYENANQVTGNPYDKGGPGSGDLACRECEIGRKLFEAGDGNKKPANAGRARRYGEENLATIEKPKEKRCSKCGETKPLDAFHRNKATKDGYEFWCKKCRKKSDSARRVKKYDGLTKPPGPAAKKADDKKACRPDGIPQPKGSDPALWIGMSKPGGTQPWIDQLNSFLLNLALLLERFRAEMTVRDGNIYVHVDGKTAFIGQPRLPRPGEDLIQDCVAVLEDHR